MKSAPGRTTGKSSIDLIEEAVEVLRAAKAATFAIYYAGAIPFVVTGLYFWTAMTRDPIAKLHLANSALQVALMFGWLRFCQAIFAKRIRTQLAKEVDRRWSVRQYVRFFVRQMVIQPSGLFVIPLSLLFIAPFGWVYGFYQTFTALSASEVASVGALIRETRKQTVLWPLQNVLALLTLAGFSLFVFLNLVVLAILLPTLLKMLLAIESAASRDTGALLNSTLMAACFGVTYLCVDPIIKTVYVLRCYYGASRTSGEDLKVTIQQFSLAAKTLAGLLLLCAILAFPFAARAQSSATGPSPTAPHISQAEVNRQIEAVLQQSKYNWRRAAEAIDEGQEGVVSRFLKKVFETIDNWLQKLTDWIRNFLRRIFSSRERSYDDRKFTWVTSSLLLYVLLGVAVIALATYLVYLQRKKRAMAPTMLAGLTVPLDITDESVRADQMPEDGWTALGRDLLQKGEWRLALRAFYLASLANLAQRNLIGIAASKSNRDYHNELMRRAHALPELLPAFGRNIVIFERIWYGTHPASTEALQEFSTNMEIIRSER